MDEARQTDQLKLRRLREQIAAYRPEGPQEEKEKERILAYMDRFGDLLWRSNETAHFTASALILNESRDKTLLIYHNQYDSWGWTGGHADGEADLLSVALREAQEETGAEAKPISREILALDILPVWGHLKKGRYVASHLHLNLTYLLEVEEKAPLRIKADENSGVGWFPLCEMEGASREREMKPVYRKLIRGVARLLPPSSPYYDTVIFDLDGTLLNSLEDLWVSTNYALLQMGFPTRSLEEVRRFVGNGVGKLIERAAPQGTSPEETARCLEVFLAHYDRHMDDKTRPYPEIPALLAELKKRGVKTAVVSNKYDGAVKKLCDRYFPETIGVAVGEGPGVRRKPNPDGVLEALRLLGSVKERCLYVGDADTDVLTAKNAGLLSVGAVWGFRDRQTLIAAGADRLLDAPLELLGLLEGTALPEI